MIIIENFNIIDCENYIYISRSDRWTSSMEKFLFDGEKAEETNRKNWYKLSKIPTEITEKQSDKHINKRYELKAGYVPTELMPNIITMEMYNSDEYEDVIGLYSLKYDTEDGGYEPIEFHIEKIYSRKDYEFVPNKYNAEVDLLTQIEYPEVAYQDRPCKVTHSQMFSIIRNYVKQNIDISCAKIKYDYDFHFEVSKNIALADPYSVMVDVNNRTLNKRRKPKWVNKMISDKQVTVLNLKRDLNDTSYGDDCCVAPEIIGENYTDLSQKVDKYLEELMKTINIKYCECPNCKGWGIVEAEVENKI
jgi:hypothetical protein